METLREMLEKAVVDDATFQKAESAIRHYEENVGRGAIVNIGLQKFGVLLAREVAACQANNHNIELLLGLVAQEKLDAPCPTGLYLSVAKLYNHKTLMETSLMAAPFHTRATARPQLQCGE